MVHQFKIDIKVKKDHGSTQPFYFIVTPPGDICYYSNKHYFSAEDAKKDAEEYCKRWLTLKAGEQSYNYQLDTCDDCTTMVKSRL